MVETPTKWTFGLFNSFIVTLKSWRRVSLFTKIHFYVWQKKELYQNTMIKSKRNEPRDISNAFNLNNMYSNK